MSNSFFSDCISNGYVNRTKFNKLCYTGIPEDERSFAYKILLNIYTKDVYECNEIDKRNIFKYKEKLSIHRISKSNSFASPINLYFKYAIPENIGHQIYIDVLRINNKYKIFQGMDFSYVYMNVLLRNSVRRPKINYIQGMSDLVIPFVLVFFKNNFSNINMETIQDDLLLEAEANVFMCFDALMKKMEHNYENMHESLIKKTRKALKKIDKTIYNYLKDIDLDIHFFVFRWFNCLFIREFEISKWFNVFNAMLSTNIDDFLINFALSIIVSCKERIMGKDFPEIVSFMQNISENDVDVCDLLGKAVYMKFDIKQK